jgi:hypothetical protein
MADIPFKNFDSSKLKIGGDDVAVAEPPVVEEPPIVEDQPQDDPVDDLSNVNSDQIVEDDPSSGGGEPTTKTTEEEFIYGEDEFKQDVDRYLSESTQGRVKSPNEISSLLQENESLKAQLKNRALEFPSEQAKKVYEFAIKPEFNGNELGAARQYLHLVSLDLTKLSPKEKQFEAYVLSRPDLSRENAAKIFDERYNRRFGEMENDMVLQDDHGVETRTAEQKILDYQKDFEKAAQSAKPAQQPEVDVQAIERDVNTALSDFDGIEMQFGDGTDETVQLPMNAEEVSAFRDILVNPIKLLDQVVQDCTVNGKFDMETYQRTMYKLQNVDRAIDEAYRAGLNNGQLKLIQERKNTTIPKGNGGDQVAPKKSFAQTMADAVKGAGKK